MKRTRVSIDLEPVTVTMGFWMSLSRALDAWARLQNARAHQIEMKNMARESKPDRGTR